MTAPLYIAHAGLWIAVAIQGIAICVLLYRIRELVDMAATGGGAGHRPAGSKAPDFEAVDLKTGELVSTDRFAGSRTFILLLTASCSHCKRLVQGLATECGKGTKIERLVLYCQGAARGCDDICRDVPDQVPFLASGKESRADATELFGPASMPAIVEIDRAWRIVGYSYPFVAADIVATVAPQAGGRLPEPIAR
ncbi:MAG: hypothetical protein OXU77_21000 [Gammaproteobacteria bacterium]|nr:hypothetical protein [Gammaproteobacteria bacterium]MDE0440681.1 hypothetical protein [Gammaproteobacteria bacterium]